MASRRTLKAAEAIREVVSMAILTELRDPRVQDVTVTFVEVAPDMRSAKVHVSIMGNESKQQLSLRGLSNSSGFLQQRIAERIDTRYTPRLQFVLDKGVKNALEVSRILAEVLPKSGDPNREDEAGEDDEATPSLARAAAAKPTDDDAVGDDDFDDDADFDDDEFSDEDEDSEDEDLEEEDPEDEDDDEEEDDEDDMDAQRRG